MAGTCPNEGENYFADLVFKNNDFKLGLFTNASLSETSVIGDITQPTGGGYAVVTLDKANCTVTADTAQWPQVSFTATGGTISGGIRGAYITNSAGTKLVQYEFDTTLGGPLTLLENDVYKVTPKITVA